MLKDIIGYLALAIVLKGIDQEMVEKQLKEVVGEKASIDDFSIDELLYAVAYLDRMLAA